MNSSVDIFMCSLSHEMSKVVDEFGGVVTCVRVVGGSKVGYGRPVVPEGWPTQRFLCHFRCFFFAGGCSTTQISFPADRGAIFFWWKRPFSMFRVSLVFAHLFPPPLSTQKKAITPVQITCGTCTDYESSKLSSTPQAEETGTLVNTNSNSHVDQKYKIDSMRFCSNVC